MSERVLARCGDCGRGYAARILDDGTLHVMGGISDCRCGSDAFTQATVSLERRDPA
ncbi:hypothetical protein [Halorarum halobium]|uniref:hypothetical protein n=1 Tax=Halorarum halobium TaxID=3075121 RepID=UPI0028A9FAAD|nr:hypothetical protein [Halobaculum sp. XH14]